MATTVTAKGRVTIPKPIREFLGIVPGSRVDFRRTANGSVVVVHVDKNTQVDRFERLRGHAGAGLDTDAVLALTRGED